MNSYITLTKTFIAAISMSPPQDKRRKIMITVLSLFALFGVLLPVSIGMGVIVYLMTTTLSLMDYESFGIQLMFLVICLFTTLFGINVIFNEFYFSNDIEFILPWPLKARQIVGAKFTSAFISENMMQFILVLSCIIGFGVSYKMNLLQWILALVGIVTLPVIPLVYCAILSMVLMAFTRIIKSRDIIQRLSVTLFFLLIVGIIASIGFLQDLDIDSYVTSLASGNQKFYEGLNIIFPHVGLYVKTFHNGDLLAFVAYLLLNVVAIGIMIVLSDFLYFKGVIGLTSGKQDKKSESLDNLLKASKQQSQFKAYFLKDVRILLRTPIFFTNCIAVNFLWPIFIYAILKIQTADTSLANIRRLYAARDFRLQLLFLLGIIGISVIVAAINSLSSNAISREGKHFSFMKYIPVPYSVQWHAKALIGIIFPLVGILIFAIPAFIVIHVPVIHILIYVWLCVLSVTFISYMGIYIDSIQPKLIWDDELSALRENYNTFFSMAIAIAYALIVCLGGFFFFCNTKTSIGFMWILLTLILAGSNLIVFILTKRSGVRNIEEQEET